MTRLHFALTFAIVSAGCGSDIHDMKISEFDKLTPEARREFAKKLTPEEMKQLFAGSAAFKADSAGFREKTVGEVIEEGKRRRADTSR